MRGLQIKRGKKGTSAAEQAGPSAAEQVGSGGVNYATKKSTALKGKKRQTSYTRLNPADASKMAKSLGEGNKKFSYSYTDKMGNVNKSVKFNDKKNSLDINFPKVNFPGITRTPKDTPPKDTPPKSGGGSTFKDKLKKKASSIKENIQSSKQKRKDLKEQNKNCRNKKGIIQKCEDFGKDLFSTKRKNKSLKRKSARKDRQVRRMKH